MSTSEKQKWMSDPLVADIAPEKLDFLQTIVFESRGKSQKEMLPFLMQVLKKGKASQLSFSEEEMSAILTAIKNNSTPEELEQINKFMAMHKNRFQKPE